MHLSQHKKDANVLCRAMHASEAERTAGDPHLLYLTEVASLAMAATVRLTSHKGIADKNLSLQGQLATVQPQQLLHSLGGIASRVPFGSLLHKIFIHKYPFQDLQKPCHGLASGILIKYRLFAWFRLIAQLPTLRLAMPANPSSSDMQSGCAAGCVEALAEAQATMLSLWLVHRPPSQTLLQLALRLLHPLSQTPATAWAACAQGGAVYLMTQLLPVTSAPPTEKVGKPLSKPVCTSFQIS